MMRRAILISILVVAINTQVTQAGAIYLDADTPATGSLLETQSLATPYGTITLFGEVYGASIPDPELIAAGSTGNVFDIDDSSDAAWLSFDFDVISATFIYGGNGGRINIEARDKLGVVVDSFYQADTGDGQPAGPVSLSGVGIRSLYWDDPGYNYAALDNITLTTGPAIPAPGAILLGGIGISLVGWLRRRRML